MARAVFRRLPNESLTVAVEWSAFQHRNLSRVDYVYLWADGAHLNARLEHERLCCLVPLGVRADGRQRSGGGQRWLSRVQQNPGPSCGAISSEEACVDCPG